jgi:hypothetical protein
MGVRLFGRILDREGWRFIEGRLGRFVTIIIIVVRWPVWWHISGQFLTEPAASPISQRAVTRGARDG